MAAPENWLSELAAVLPSIALQQNAPLSGLGGWRIGGPARALVTVASAQEASRVVRISSGHGIPLVVVGNGSNILFDDSGVNGIALRLSPALATTSAGDDGVVEVGAACPVPCFVARLIRAGLAGAEHAIGIPGTVGGLVAMNGGSRRRAIGEQLEWVEAVTLRGSDAGRIERLGADRLALAYRSSRLLTGDTLITTAGFRFQRGDRQALRREALAILAERRGKFPRRIPNCGSVFASDPALHDSVGTPGQAIEAAGLKGRQIGGAQISPQHANFIVNRGGARSADVLALAAEMRAAVLARTGISLRGEVRHLSPDGRLRRLDEVLDA